MSYERASNLILQTSININAFSYLHSAYNSSSAQTILLPLPLIFLHMMPSCSECNASSYNTEQLQRNEQVSSSFCRCCFDHLLTTRLSADSQPGPRQIQSKRRYIIGFQRERLHCFPAAGPDRLSRMKWRLADKSGRLTTSLHAMAVHVVAVDQLNPLAFVDYTVVAVQSTPPMSPFRVTHLQYLCSGSLTSNVSVQSHFVFHKVVI